MRTLFIVGFVALGSSSFSGLLHAQTSTTCKQCRDQQKACMANYSGKTCKTEFDICMKSCKQK
jgi:hypothetical protein